MTKYELKKIFSRTGSRVALVLLAVFMGLTCYFAAGVGWVDGNGDEHKGMVAVSELRKAQKEWAGYLDEEMIRKVIAENRRIRESPEAQSEIIRERDIAFSWQQGIEEIRDLLNHSYAVGFRDYDYYQANSLTEDDAVMFYENRTRLLKEWLAGEAKDQFSDKEKEYLIRRYESIQTPFYCDYVTGWKQLFEYAPTIVMLIMLVLGYLVAGIFSNEFTWRSDAVFYTSVYGRDRAVLAKIKAGLLVVTLVYFAAFMLYTVILLCYYGMDGWNLMVQAAGSWKCFYHITVWQKYLLILIGGYIGCMFISFLSMLVSAKTKSSVLAVMVLVVLIFIPSFLENINSPVINKIIGLLPDQLLQTGAALNYFNLYPLGKNVVGEVPIIMTVYAVLTVVLLPLIYQEYRHKEIS